MSGTIYKITNDLNTMIYIGQTRQPLHRRFSKHKSDCKNYPKNPLYIAIRELGVNKFKIEPLYENVPIDELNKKEIEAIEENNSLHPNGYNSVKGGGVKKEVSEETRKKLSDALKGKPQSEGSGMKGRIHTEETKKKQRDVQKGKELTEEHKKAMRGSRKLTEEQINEIRENKEGLLQSEMATKYNCSKQLINNIVRNKNIKY